MINTTAINLKDANQMAVTWDTGRRCNYDCSYCEASHHSNSTDLHSYDELLKTFNFIKDWTTIYNEKRKINLGTNINFTGGEPTVNLNFWKIAEYIKRNHKEFSLGLTTNGAWANKNTNLIKDLFNGITVSYHTEADPKLKKQVLENIKSLHSHKINLQVNVMLHVDFFEECQQVCDELKSLGIKYNPRPIGDGNVERTGWYRDTDGFMRRTSHNYTEEQQKWFFNQTNSKKVDTSNKEGTQLGRACCGGRCTLGKVEGTWQEVKLINTNFKDWHCMIDWFFLHIDQHTGLIYHHQTCKALYNNTRGPIGHIDNHERLIKQLNDRFSKETLEHIICPNQRCGCGMCVPKAKDLNDFKLLWNEITSLKFN